MMKGFLVAGALVLAGSVSATAAPTTVNYGYDLPGFPGSGSPHAYSAPSIDLGGITVTGSSNVYALGYNGLGIVGGHANAIVDTGEWIRFDFDDGPAADVSYFNAICCTLTGSHPAVTRTLEAFASDGASLGVVGQTSTGTLDVSALFGSAPISAFVLTATDIGIFRIGSVTYTAPETDMSVVPLPLAGPMLLAGLGLLAGIGRVARRA